MHSDIADSGLSKEDESYFRKIYGRRKVPLEEILSEKKGGWMTNQQCLRSLFKVIKKEKRFIPREKKEDRVDLDEQLKEQIGDKE